MQTKTLNQSLFETAIIAGCFKTKKKKHSKKKLTKFQVIKLVFFPTFVINVF